MKFIKFYNEGANDSIISQFAKKFDIDKTVMEIIYAKGYRTEKEISDFLNPLALAFEDPFLLSGMFECVKKIKQAVVQKKKILIFGDYDVDGISATAVMLKTLAKMGVKAKSYLPNRYIDGYGLTTAVIDKIIKTDKPELIITVDCGISCHEEVKYCKDNGIDIIVTDHHEIPEILPDTIIVNPKLKEQKYDFNGLCGTGVAFKIAQALLGEQETEDLLPIVAIATIADIVPLIRENRIIVAKGLSLIKKHLPLGLREMFKANKLKINQVDSSDIAFKIAPKLNASGRMGDASDSLDLIMETNPVRIKELLEKINNHNTKRQALCNVVYEDCKKMLSNYNLSKTPAIILQSDNWDHGILGIACSRLVEEYNRPVFLFSNHNGELKGSARSIPDINIHHILQSLQDILEVFGGHKVAAGLTLKEKNFVEFKNRVCSFIYENINDRVFIPIEYYDAELKVSNLTPKLIKDLKLLEPCGSDNPKPRFLIKTQNAQIMPLKNSPAHANMVVGKKLYLIFFHYFKQHAKLNFGKEYHFIFELQDESKNCYKGVIKNFTSDVDVKDSAKNYIDAFSIKQIEFLKTKNKNIAVYENYEKKNILEFIMNCKSTIFGTCFITYNFNNYKEFISSYDLSNIYEYNIYSTTNTGFNAIFVSPNDLNFVKSYKNIIFLDAIYDESFIRKINQISDAKIFVPNDMTSEKNIFKSINLDRKFARYIYSNLLNFEGNQYASCLSVYTKIVKENKINITINNFLFYFEVFKELNIINVEEEDGFFVYKINKSIKSDLFNSSIYNYVRLLNKIS